MIIKIKPTIPNSSPPYGKSLNKDVSPKKEINGASNNPEQAAHPTPKIPKNIPVAEPRKPFDLSMNFCFS